MEANIIKYEGDNSTFIWKHPVEDFNTGTQLIVHESQQALFFANGQALDLFGPGRHTLETQNIPLIRKLFALPFGKETPFHAEVYFINLTDQMAIKWGTDSKVEYIDPKYGFPLKIGASGEMTLRAEDARKMVVRLVGTESTLTQSSLTQKFRGILMSKLKTYLATLIRQEQIDIFAIDEHLTSMSVGLQKLLTPDYDEYGLALERFVVTTIVKPEDDPNYQCFRNLHFRQYADVAEAELKQKVGVIDQQTSARRMVIEAEGLAKKRQLEGYTYQQERGFDVAEGIAHNQAIGQMSNLGIGLGMMGGVSQLVGETMGNTMKNSVLDKCPSCGAPVSPNARFCPSCGASLQQKAEDNLVVCPHCGQKTPKGKFCSNCGKPLQQTCVKCGAPISAGAKFCPNCGTPVEGGKA